MTAEQIVFYIFATLTIVSALGVVTVRNSVQAVLCLVLTFFSAAVLWMLLEAEFLAIALVLVYVGAVMVLFLFVVMMLDVDFASLNQGFTRYVPLGILVAIGLLIGLYWVLRGEVFGLEAMPEPVKHGAEHSNVEVLGRLLYTDYFYAFEIAGVILLVAIVAAISLTFRGRRERRGQSVPSQHRASKDERLHIVKMDAEVAEPEESEPEEKGKRKSKRNKKPKGELP
ncbi:NADH-quinone oxidoreductase subunit J [Kangiella koreensis]|uniref:NADH-quinone oxidoreductase subunit J n=1 Tax=Kangiella koreensis (strain DSM 16069 / JCM 12317 / KCTC 12182 / SW-125) TaxID=523791 RepID=C7R7H0_KANKD|nr:NADH-quinone oxidoreductase subunit J [Kangiella koreensis]ACV25719.1 NADH-ubiquinone/plastoquinone oxidoreductase chain 6 [Kangiella koreensis DSM 16069]